MKIISPPKIDQLKGVKLTKAKEERKKQLTSEFNHLNEQTKFLKDDIVVVKKDLDKALKDKAAISKSIKALADEKGAYKDTIAIQKKKISDYGKTIRSLETEIGDLKEARGEVFSEMMDYQKEANAAAMYVLDIDETRDEKASLKKEIGRLKGVQKKIKGSIKDLDKDLILAKKDCDKKLESYVAKMTKAGEKASKNSRELIAVENELKNTISGLKKAEDEMLQKADDSVLELRAETKNLKEEKAITDGDIFKANKELGALKLKIEAGRKELEDQKVQLEKQKIDVLDEIAQLKLRHKLTRIEKAGLKVD